MTDKAGQAYSGKAQVAFCQRLGDSWRDLATYLEIPPDEQKRFPKGDEGRQILHWLQQRDRLEELPPALEAIGYQKLALLLRPLPEPPADRQPWQEGSPYPGLVPFSARYASVFFGRDRHTTALLERLKNPAQRFLAVVGASGSGKSSLVAAGLLPKLKENALPGSQDWIVLEFTPEGPAKAPDPFAGLASALEPYLKPSGWRAGEINRKLRARGGLTALAGQMLSQQQAQMEVLLFIDQFEELFTRCGEEDHPLFISLLEEASRSPHLRVVLTLRSDFYPRCLKYPRLTDLLNAGQYSLSTPSVVDLYAMITQPAARAGLHFEDPELPLEILTDTGTAPGALALMAFALSELYERRQEAELTRAAYKAFGGVRGVIGRLAEEAYGRLDQEARAALPTVFKELIEIDPEAGVPTRKRVLLSDFGKSPAAMRLIGEFSQQRARLLVCNEDVVEVAHEALLTHWNVLSSWIEARFDDLRLLRRVRLEAAEWRRHRGYLWPHERLVAVYRMRENLQPHLNRVERAFIRPESDRLLKRIRNPATSHQARAKIGDRLAEISDPCPGVGLGSDGLPDLVWCPVPGGKIKLEDVKGVFTVKPFQIVKYPVTYRQYRAFLEAPDGYGDPRWWAGLAHRDEQPGVQYRPVDNHPAENISWFDAVAFCRWLSVRLGYEIRLPTEWEWQQAATGGSPANEYPWGEDWNAACANTWESGLSRTTAVGLYPQGASPVGAMDMSGTVWEWCLNEYDSPKRTDLSGEASRVVRGGSWGGSQGGARAAYRGRDDPASRSLGVGFRLVCASPIV